MNMRGVGRLTVTTAVLIVALLPMIASVSPEAATTPRESTMPVAIAQPLAALDGTPLVALPADGADPTLSESAMLVLVGSALIGLAALVRRAT